MRRRRSGGRNLTAEQLSDLYTVTALEFRDEPAGVRNEAVHRALAAHGFTPLDALRARFWLRRGRPAGYVWDDADALPQWR